VIEIAETMPIAIVLVGEERNQTHEYQKAIENISHLPISSIRTTGGAKRRSWHKVFDPGRGATASVSVC
jgi:hypothetical protein